ncbi:MAG: uracil-DNA glycosylase [Blastocatellia bacterium]|nr:uracil-DNA glycosylase [Blastocatellia bacterium]
MPIVSAPSPTLVVAEPPAVPKTVAELGPEAPSAQPSQTPPQVETVLAAQAQLPTTPPEVIETTPTPPTTMPTPSVVSIIKLPPKAQTKAAAPQFSLFDMPEPEPQPVVAAPVTDTCLQDIRDDIGDCTRCKLSQHRNKIVFGDGSPNPELVFVGEGPGADEDRTGIPFVGQAGELLNKIIEAIGMKRAQVYICNVVKCRPPGNRTPERDEIDACNGFLHRQLAVLKPKIIVALGAPAAFTLLEDNRIGSITAIRGNVYDYHGVPLMVTFHPAYLLRVPAKKREVWEDMKIVRGFLRGEVRME